MELYNVNAGRPKAVSIGTSPLNIISYIFRIFFFGWFLYIISIDQTDERQCQVLGFITTEWFYEEVVRI